MKGMFLKALSLTLLVPTAMVVANQPVEPTVDVKVTAEAVQTVEATTVEAVKPAAEATTKPAETTVDVKAATEAAKTVEAVKAQTWGEYASAKYATAKDAVVSAATTAKDAVVSATNSSVDFAKAHPYATAGVATAAVAGLGYLGYRYFTSPKDANVKSAKAAGTNSISNQDIANDIKVLEAIKSAKNGALTFDRKSLKALNNVEGKNKQGKQEVGLYVRRLQGHVDELNAAITRKSSSVQARREALNKFVNAVIKLLQSKMVKAEAPKKAEVAKQQPAVKVAAVKAAAQAPAAAATNSDAKQTWSEYIKSGLTLKNAAIATGVAAATAAGAYGVYHYLPQIKAALGIGKEVASTTVLASAATKIAKDAVTETPKTEVPAMISAPNAEVTSTVAPQAEAGEVAKK